MRDTFGGRDKIIAAGDLYTPRLPAATPQTQLSYLHRGNYYNAVRRTVSGLVGGVFQKHHGLTCLETLIPGFEMSL